MPARLAPLLVAGCLLAGANRVLGETTTADGVTTTANAVSVFIPGYGTGDWSAYRGSVIASDSALTTYTIFCAPSTQTPAACLLDTDLPLTFAEGPGTLRYDGTLSGEITAHLSCKLKGTTEATCTGSSSYGTGFREGPITGPTVTTWTKTMAASDIEWGVLSLTTPPAKAATTDLDAGGTPTANPSYVTGTESPASAATGSGSRSVPGNDWLGWNLVVACMGATAVLL